MKIAFLLDQFELQSPGQQLLDRLLIGYNQNGQFHRSDSTVLLSMPGANENPLVQTRVKDFGLQIASSTESAVAAADSVVIAQHSSGNRSNQDVIGKIVQMLPAGKPCFVLGLLAPTRAGAQLIVDTAQKRSVPLSAGTAASHLIPLPTRPVYDSRKIARTLVVTQGNFPDAESEALYGMLPYLDTNEVRGGIQSVEPVEKKFTWQMLYSRAWLPLLQAAVSRSNNIKGDPERDGRTQDIVGLRLIERLAVQPRAWLLRIGKNTEAAIFILDGALTDINISLQSGGEIHSAQLYRAPGPMRDHFSDLAVSVLTFLSNQTAPGKIEEALCAATALEMMERRS